MGLYDTLLVTFENRTLELQTKHFECLLETYTEGDVVVGAMSGIQGYFDEVHLDDSGKQCYDVRNAARMLTVFIVLVDRVFVESTVTEGELSPDIILLKIEALRQKWMDGGLMRQRLIQALIAGQNTIRQLQVRVRCALHTINESRRLQSSTVEDDRISFIFCSDETKRLKAGENVLDVIESCLKMNPKLMFHPEVDMETDPLQAYRL